MKLTRLKIHRYRGVPPGSELAFHPSFNLVIGQNGTGRTTLLELISLALGSDFSGLLREEFSLEYSVALPDMEIQVSVRNEERAAGAQARRAPIHDSALLPLSPPATAPDFDPYVELVLLLQAPAARLVLRADGTGVAWDVDGKPGYAQAMQWSLLDRPLWLLLFMTAQYLAPEIKGRLKALLRDIFLLAPFRFDESLGTFDRIGTLQYAMEVREGEVFPLGLMALPTWLPGRIHERVEQEPSATLLEFGHEEVEHGFLARFVALAGFARGTLRMELLQRRVFEGGGRLEFGRFDFRFTRRDGSVLSQAHLGHGQKRLLSFLYYLDVNEHFVVADELANSLHPRWIEACLRAIGDRQAFVSSQSPLLLQRVPAGSRKEIRSALVLCESGLREGREQWRWSNPSEAFTRALYRASRVGSDELEDVLRDEGWW